MGQFRAFYPKLRFCMPTNAICFYFSEVNKEISIKRCFIGCLIRISVKVLFHDIFCTEATFGQKLLNVVFPIMIL